ncbi:MAG: hypothetical protein ACXV9R_10325 [Methylobacter sp.]
MVTIVTILGRTTNAVGAERIFPQKRIAKMKMISTGHIVVNRFIGNSVYTSAYESLLDLVLDTIDNGLIGGGIHGSEGHIAALKEVEIKIAEIKSNALPKIVQEQGGE